jgi:hypothetical protein
MPNHWNEEETVDSGIDAESTEGRIGGTSYSKTSLWSSQTIRNIAQVVFQAIYN